MRNLFDLSGKVAVITGGNTGIGLGMAEAVAAAGSAVAIWGRNTQANAAAVQRLREAGAQARSFVCDVSDSAAVDRAFAETLEALGRVDACFANAGISRFRSSFLAITDDDWRGVLGVNLDSVFFTFRAALRHMVARAEAGDPGGRLIATSSIGALAGMVRHQHYGAAKAGVVSLTRSLAVEYGPIGVTANALLPGWTYTDMTKPVFDNPEFADHMVPKIPAQRWGVPADFGGIAVYLMSDASAYHTGGSFVIDGGYMI